MNAVPNIILVGFDPRKEVFNWGEAMVDQFMDFAPPDSHCSAVIERLGEVFLFEVTIRTITDIFYCRIDVNINDSRCRQRHWQLNVIEQIQRELKMQISEKSSRKLNAK